MGKIVFLQNEYEDKIGVLSLIAYLKLKGHFAELFIIDGRNWLDEVKEYKPDLLGFSVLTGGHLYVESCAQEIKQYKRCTIPIIVGGAHPTFFPEIINNPHIDYICRGEGELAIEELLERIDRNGDLTSIPNIWAKIDDMVFKNDVRPLIEDLNILPEPDRSHYAKYTFLKSNPHKKIITSRGCPFSCTYCYNSAFKVLYKNKGQILRRRSVENVLKEILHLQQVGGWKTLEIVDDAFLADRKWFLQFAEEYHNKVNLPYACFSIVNNIDKEVAEALKRSKCKCVLFGIEAGNERIRRDVYKKRVSNNDILRGAAVLHEAGIEFLTFNMVGAPFETFTEMEETIHINQKIKTDHPWCSIMQPYPGTEIFDYCVEKGLIDKNAEITSFTYFEECILKNSKKRIREIRNIQRLFFILSKWRFLNRFCRIIVNLPFTPLYTLIFYICYAYSLRKRYNLRLRHLFLYWLTLERTKKYHKKKTRE